MNQSCTPCKYFSGTTSFSLYLQIRPDLVHELEVGETHLVALDPVENETMSVTVIDANHCPGAVMYIFEVNISVRSMFVINQGKKGLRLRQLHYVFSIKKPGNQRGICSNRKFRGSRLMTLRGDSIPIS